MGKEICMLASFSPNTQIYVIAKILPLLSIFATAPRFRFHKIKLKKKTYVIIVAQINKLSLDQVIKNTNLTNERTN